MSSGDEIVLKELPTEILAEILSRLPLKSFNRFKAVSKSWLALSSDPTYSKKFRKFQLAGLYCKLDDTHGHKSSMTHFASLSTGSVLDTTMTNFPHQKDCDLELLDCCNGLLLFRCQTVDPPCFYISNPFTKKWISISTPTAYHGKFVLAYDPSISAHFQVILFEIRKRDNTITNLTIMSSDKGKWIRSRSALPNRKDLFFDKTNRKDLVLINGETIGNTLLNGTLYLLVSKNILAVKIKGWSCSMIQLPDTKPTVNDRITKCKGKMQYISNTTSMIQIWDLDMQSEKEWSLNYNLDIQNLFGNYMQSMNIFSRLIQVHPDHDVIFVFCWKDENTRTIVSYDLSNGDIEEVCILQNKFEQNTFYYMPSFSDCVSMNVSAMK